jgi:aspartyl-tRNA(Asn)/glutamyl-tRNA(Gln) amidotransferase subunit A
VSNICDLDLQGVSEAIRTRRVSSAEATAAYLERIERHDGVLMSYLTVTGERAMAQARVMDAELTAGHWRGPLHGVPIALKDLIETAGVRTTGGSRALRDNVPTTNSPIVDKLDAAGAVMLGKTAMHEFAFGRPRANGEFATGRNPWNVERVTAGSSSGSGAAMAAGLCAGSLGSDTGGSIRGPASFCGLVGHKPSYGLVTRRGVLPMCWSLDHVGPMVRSTWDAAVMLQAIAGHDPGDASTSSRAVPSYTEGLEAGVRGVRLGLLRRHYLEWPDLHADVKSASEAAFGELANQGARITDVDAPMLDQAVHIWLPFLSEMFDYHKELVRERGQDYWPSTRHRLYMGAMFSAADMLRAQRLRTVLARQVALLFDGVDALIFPGQAMPAAPFGYQSETEVIASSNRFTAPWNLLGLPACVVPCGFSADGLPVSIQIVGRPFDDATVLRIARAYERACDWNQRRPDPAGWKL